MDYQINKYILLFETGVWLAGLVIQGTGFTWALEMPPWFFNCTKISTGMATVIPGGQVVILEFSWLNNLLGKTATLFFIIEHL